MSQIWVILVCVNGMCMPSTPFPTQEACQKVAMEAWSKRTDKTVPASIGCIEMSKLETAELPK